MLYLSVSLTHNLFCISTHQLCAYARLGRLCGVANPLPGLLPGYVGILTITTTREKRERRLKHLGNEGQGGQIPQEVFEQLYPLCRRSLFCVLFESNISNGSAGWMGRWVGMWGSLMFGHFFRDARCYPLPEGSCGLPS